MQMNSALRLYHLWVLAACVPTLLLLWLADRAPTRHGTALHVSQDVKEDRTTEDVSMCTGLQPSWDALMRGHTSALVPATAA